jgi:uncharacterized protein (TIGR02147 family)
MYSIPALGQYRSVSDFFDEFCKCNEHLFSHRDFAAQIGWPVSLLADLRKGRKRLTVARVTEFSRFLNLNHVQTEYLLMLSLRESGSDDSLQNYVESYFKAQAKHLASDSLEELDFPHRAIENKIFYQWEVPVIHAVIGWSCGRISDAKELAQILSFLPNLSDPEYLAQILNYMRNEGIITGDFPQFKLLQEGLRPDHSTSPEKKFEILTLLRQMAERPNADTRWQSGNLSFPKSHRKELEQKIDQLRDWIINTSIEHPPHEESFRETHDILLISLLMTGYFTQ